VNIKPVTSVNQHSQKAQTAMELIFLLVLILLMVIALGSGYPVAFALPGAAILTIALAAICGQIFAGDASAYFAQGGPVQWLSAGVTNFRGVYWEVERDTLIAIPLFIFMGIMLQRSKIAEDLLVTMAQLFGPIPGGLGISVVFVGALLAATTGIVGATVVAMGLISLPAMLQHNYSRPLATGTIAASGTLGQIIPPSIVLIILADQLASAVDQAGTSRKEFFKEATGELTMPSEFDIVSTSAGEMFLGALIPGLVLVGLYMAFILGWALLRPGTAPPVPFTGKMDRRFVGRVLLILVPPLALIFLVLGSIIAGIATVNQAGAIGAVGALVMAGYRLKPNRRDTFFPAILALISLGTILFVTTYHDVNIKNIQTDEDRTALMLALAGVGGLTLAIIWSGWRAYKIEDTLRGVMIDTAKTTSLVFIILLGAAMLTAAFRSFGGEELVKDFLNGLPGGFWSKFVIVMAVIFVLGFFLDFIEIAVVVVPIVAPILLADPSANVTAVWLGVMIGLNIQTSFLTPPFGFALFYLRGVAPAVVRTTEMYKGVIAFISLQLLALGIVGNYPTMVNYLPNRVSLTSETAPPPLNPRLQYCMEEYVFEQVTENGDTLRQSIETARGLNYTALPDDLREEIAASFDTATTSLELIVAVKAAESEVEKNADAYRPFHRKVRDIESAIRGAEREIKEIRDRNRRVEAGSTKAQKIEHEIAELNAEIDALRAEIPADWTSVQAAFQEFTKAERLARIKYRRSVDAAYKPVGRVMKVLEATPLLDAVRADFAELLSGFRDMEPEAVGAQLKLLEESVSELPGGREIRQMMEKARGLLESGSQIAQVSRAMIDANIALNDELRWRKRATANLGETFPAYEAAIRDTIGLRGQRKLPTEQALYVAACSSEHRDISLSF
jgi:tripartite ATP-independent transporter DctM subunit